MMSLGAMTRQRVVSKKKKLVPLETSSLLGTVAGSGKLNERTGGGWARSAESERASESSSSTFKFVIFISGTASERYGIFSHPPPFHNSVGTYWVGRNAPLAARGAALAEPGFFNPAKERRGALFLRLGG